MSSIILLLPLQRGVLSFHGLFLVEEIVVLSEITSLLPHLVEFRIDAIFIRRHGPYMLAQPLVPFPVFFYSLLDLLLIKPLRAIPSLRSAVLGTAHLNVWFQGRAQADRVRASVTLSQAFFNLG